MHVFSVGGRLYWRDGDPIPSHVVLRPETDVIELPDLMVLAAIAADLAEDDYGEESFP